jgi:DNA-binding transcriptional regulator YdaS (Cro superfamily)
VAELQYQLARVLARAQAIAGSREALADALGADPSQVADWILRRSAIPNDVLEKAVGIILEAFERSAGTPPQIGKSSHAAGPQP